MRQSYLILEIKNLTEAQSLTQGHTAIKCLIWVLMPSGLAPKSINLSTILECCSDPYKTGPSGQSYSESPRALNRV